MTRPHREVARRNRRRAATTSDAADAIDAQWRLRSWATIYRPLMGRPRVEIVDVSGPLFERERRR